MPARGTAGRYAWYVVCILVLVSGFNFLDRYIFIILMEPIKLDLGLSDTQLGLISGLGFSAVYSVAGLVIARWADLGNRRNIVTIALASWSTLTAICGLTASFVQLLLARMAVGVAEAGCSPPAHSLISDYIPARQRALAFAMYAVGLDVGMGLGFALGGWVGENYGWRTAFIVAGVPGLVLAGVMAATVREPKRGASEIVAVDATRYSSRQAVTYMWRRRSFIAYMTGSALFTFAGTAIDSWAPLFLMRVQHLSSAYVGLWTGLLGSGAGLLGSLGSGWIADRLSVRDQRWNLGTAIAGIAMVVPATLLFVFGPASTVWVCFFIATFFNAFYMAPTIALTHRLLPVRMRAFASAVMLLGYNLIGTSGCNFLIGFLSDAWAGSLRVDSVRYAMAVTQAAAVLGIILTVYAMLRMPRDFEAQFPAAIREVPA
jgi:MFS family permease